MITDAVSHCKYDNSRFKPTSGIKAKISRAIKGATQLKAQYDTISVYLRELLGRGDTGIFLNNFMEVSELKGILILLDIKYNMLGFYWTDNG